MTTFVGTQTDFASALKELVELDYDAVEAYQAAINRLDNENYKTKLEEFKKDHERHIQELSDVLRAHNENAPDGPSGKQWLTKGKVVLANVMGDNAILSAMLDNELDTNKAYETMASRSDIWEDTIEYLNKGLEDEKRHKHWFERLVNEVK